MPHFNLVFFHSSFLSDLSLFCPRQTIEIWDGQLSDLSPLAGLTSLQTIEIQGGPLSDLSPLADPVAWVACRESSSRPTEVERAVLRSWSAKAFY